MRAGRRGTGMNDKKTKEADGRESVSMLPGVTVGVMIAVIAFVLSLRRVEARVRVQRHQPAPVMGRPPVRGRHDPPVHVGDMGIPQRPHPRTLVPVGRTRAVQPVQRDGQRVARMAQRRRHAPHVGRARNHEHPAHRPALLYPPDRDHRRRPPRQTRQDHRQGRRPR